MLHISKYPQIHCIQEDFESVKTREILPITQSLYYLPKTRCIWFLSLTFGNLGVLFKQNRLEPSFPGYFCLVKRRVGLIVDLSKKSSYGLCLHLRKRGTDVRSFIKER